MENAFLRYLGDDRGWNENQSTNLVDEQETTYQFTQWEPNYPNPVTVEMLLPEPVRADEIRVGQAPYSSVGGALDLVITGVDGTQVTGQIALSGQGGWSTLTMDPTFVFDRFTITRSAVPTNIVELFICLAP